jgi:DNA-binding HxlR family transcriptional regulator
MQAVGGKLCVKAEKAFALLSKKWNGLIILGLAGAAMCFNELMRVQKGLSARILSLRLKELEEAGLVSRIVMDGSPIRVRYRLTERGEELASILESISKWASAEDRAAS